MVQLHTYLNKLG